MTENRTPEQAGVRIARDHSEPLRFENIEPLAGVTAEPGQKGQAVKVWTRLAVNSDDPLFHQLVEGLDGVLRHMAERAGNTINLRWANTVLLVIRPENRAELWVDTAAVALQCRVKRDVAAGTEIFEKDIADISGMAFHHVGIGERDQVLYLFREGWGFGLAFDFNPEGKLDFDSFSATLGTLYRELRYRHLYQAVNNPAIFGPLLTAGWFPFVEIISSEFRDLARHAEAGFDLGQAEAEVIAAFDAARLGHLFDRWVAKPHFSAKEALLKEAIEAFTAQKPASVIKIILTEIEGVLNDAHKAAHDGQGAKIKGLLAFAQTSAEQRSSGPNSLFFPAEFGHYLETHTFAKFDPVAQTGTAGSRHAVGHGAAAQDSYTMTRALQAILTLDQLAFYT